MLFVHVFVYLYIKLKIVHRCNTISFTFFCFQVKNLKNVKHLKNTRNRLCHTEVLYLLVLWTTIVYSDKDNLQFLLLCYFVSYIYRERHVFIYMICENWWEDLCIVLFWSECSTLVPLCTFVRHPLKIRPTVVSTRHFLYYPEVFANAMLLGSLKQVLWKEPVFYVYYLHNKVTRLLRTKVQTIASILKFYSQILFLILFFFF